MNKKKRRNLLFAVVLAAVLAAEIIPSAALAAISEIPQTQDLSPADPSDISATDYYTGYGKGTGDNAIYNSTYASSLLFTSAAFTTYSIIIYLDENVDMPALLSDIFIVYSPRSDAEHSVYVLSEPLRELTRVNFKFPGTSQFNVKEPDMFTLFNAPELELGVCSLYL